MDLFLELTRRCNMTCSHCLRGDAQNQVMPEHIVLMTMQKLGQWDTLGIGGGEPLASAKLMKQLRHWMLYARFYPSEVYMVTNGLGMLKSSNSIIQALENLPTENIALHVSTDQWHDECGNDFDANDRFEKVQNETADSDKIYASSRGNLKSHQLLGMGRRKNGGLEESIESEHTVLYVDIHGFVWASCNLSYSFMKRFRDSPMCLGNVLTSSLEEIMEKKSLIELHILESEHTVLYITEYYAGVDESAFKKEFVSL